MESVPLPAIRPAMSAAPCPPAPHRTAPPGSRFAPAKLSRLAREPACASQRRLRRCLSFLPFGVALIIRFFSRGRGVSAWVKTPRLAEANGFCQRATKGENMSKHKKPGTSDEFTSRFNLGTFHGFNFKTQGATILLVRHGATTHHFRRSASSSFVGASCTRPRTRTTSHLILQGCSGVTSR
jgi:hypothetical protein